MSAVIEYASPNEILAAATVLPALSIVVVGARFYARYVQQNKRLIDDWLTIPALLCVIGMGISLIVGVARQSIGYPTPQFQSKQEALTGTLPQLVTILEIEYIFDLLSIIALGLTKLSVVFFCRRLFVVQKKSAFNIITWFYIVVIVIWTLLFFLQTVPGCRGNVEAQWASNEVQAKACPTDGEAWEEAWAMSDFITDIFVIALPIPMVWRLHATPSKKLAVSAVFLVGLVAVAASTTRFAIFTKLIYRTVPLNGLDQDREIVHDLSVECLVDFDAVFISVALYWTMIETSLSLIAACLPSLRFMVGSVSLDNVIRSVRSAISLRSVHSSERSSRSNKSSATQRDTSQAPYIQMPDMPSLHSEAYPLNRVGKTSEKEDVPDVPSIQRPDAIRVETEFSQTETMV